MSEKINSIDIANKVIAYTAGGAFAAAAVINMVKAGGTEMHSTLPVIGQFVDHAGNVALSGAFAFAAKTVVDKIDKKAGLTTAQRVVGVGAMGLAIGAGFNAIPDTQVGMDHVGKYLYNCENANPAEDANTVLLIRPILSGAL